MSTAVTRAIKKRAKELKVDVVYSKKGHYNTAAGWSVVHYLLGIATAGTAGFVGVKNSSIKPSTVVVLSLTAAALGAIMTFLKPQEKATQHKLAGDDFDNLLQQICNFIEVELLQGNDDDHTTRLTELVDKKTELNKASLPIPRLAYTRTRKGLQDGEASYTEKF